MRDLKIKFGDARDNAKQSIRVNIHEGAHKTADLEQLTVLLGQLREAAQAEKLPDTARGQIARDADRIEHEARQEKPAADKIVTALQSASGILKAVGVAGGTLFDVLGRIRALFGV